MKLGTEDSKDAAMKSCHGYCVGALMFGILQGMYGDKYETFIMYIET